jgi:hypothetical protein
MADYYVDASVSSASGSGSGTLGDPWVKTDDLLQFALDQIAAGSGRDTVNGDRITNLAGSMTVTSGLDPTAYGTPTNTAPLYFNGGLQRTPYDLGGFSFVDSALGSSTKVAMHLTRMDFTNPNTASDGIYIGSYGSIIDCSYVGSSSNSVGAIFLGNYATMIGCKCTNINGLGLGGGPVFNFSSYAKGYGNFFEFNGGYGQYGFYTRSQFSGNVIVQKNMASGVACWRTLDGTHGFNNTLYGDGNDLGIYAQSSSDNYLTVVNNYVENFSTGFFVSTAADYNIFAGNYSYGNISDQQNNANGSFVENNVVLGSSGLVDAANGDFRPNQNLIAKGYSPLSLSLPLSEVPTIGAITGNIMTPRIRDIY